MSSKYPMKLASDLASIMHVKALSRSSVQVFFFFFFFKIFLEENIFKIVVESM